MDFDQKPLPTGEAGHDRGKAIQVGFVGNVVGDPPTLPARLEVFDHLVHAPEQHIGTLEDPRLVENLVELEPRTRLVSIVVGKNSQAGRVWTSRDCYEEVAKIIVVGDELSYYSATGRPQPSPPPPAAVFDRALALTTAGALHRLSQMVVAVVGVNRR